MKDLFNITKYNESQIETRFIRKRKSIKYSAINQLVFVGNSIVVLPYSISLTNINKKGNILRRYFRGNIMFYLGNDERLLLLLSNNTKCRLYCIGKISNLSKKLEKYFEVLYV